MLFFFKKFFNRNYKIYEKIKKISSQIDNLKYDMKKLANKDFCRKTKIFKKRIANGEKLDDILVEAYALVREASFRTIKEFPYKVQVMGAIALHYGDIAEMKTGEGKTLTSVMPAYLNSLSGKNVHIVTVNEYLVKRDYEWMGKIFTFLGLTVGYNLNNMTIFEKQKNFKKDIIYTTNSEIGFDYLKDNMVFDKKMKILKSLNYAIIDEVDSILIDESRTPLIISGASYNNSKLYKIANKFVKNLINKKDFVIDVKSKTIQLTEKGFLLAEIFFKVKNLFKSNNIFLVYHINNALKANYILKKDVDYIVKNNNIIIVNPFTGRLMPGKEYSDGLHQAISAKENVKIKEETKTLATITYQNFFRLYKKLSGMSGTAKTEEKEFLEIYNMRVICIPTNKPIIRIDKNDLIYSNKKAKFLSLLKFVKKLHLKKQPILVGTISVNTSEFISFLMKKNNIKHNILNAKNHKNEANIIKNAGEAGSVTIATNMAGRGTDIKLSKKSKKLGGLAVLGSERHEARRIDDQLRGRSGRQGDPGYSRFFISFEDDLMVRYGSDRYKNFLSSILGNNSIENSFLTKQITVAQKRIESINFDIRKNLLEYDDVMREQREIIYNERNYILKNNNFQNIIKNIFKKFVIEILKEYNVSISIFSNKKKNNISNFRNVDILKIKKIFIFLKKFNLINKNLEFKDFNNKKMNFKIFLYKNIFEKYKKKLFLHKKIINKIEKKMLLFIIDKAWSEHISNIMKLRETIYLRTYAQKKPINAYIKESYKLFNKMFKKIIKDITLFCVNIRIKKK